MCSLQSLFSHVDCRAGCAKKPTEAKCIKDWVTGLMLPLLILVSSDRLAVMIDQITINGSVGNCQATSSVSIVELLNKQGRSSAEVKQQQNWKTAPHRKKINYPLWSLYIPCS